MTPNPTSGPPRRRRTSRWAALTGLLAAGAYLAGALASGGFSPWARRPLLDGLAPRAPYRWVKPPPELAASNKPPSDGHFEVKLTATGSEVGAFSTQDTQVTLIMGENAFKPSPGQSAVAVDVAPLGPATLGPPPGGLLVAGNAYRIDASYLSAKRKIDKADGELSIGLVYPLLATPVADPAGHVLLHSRDGRDWRQLPSVDVPATHQVNAQLTELGYVMVAIPPGSGGGESLLDRVRRQAPLVAGIVLLLLAVVFFFRRREAYQQPEDDGDTDEDEGGEPPRGNRKR
jgi:hypothetical protein